MIRLPAVDRMGPSRQSIVALAVPALLLALAVNFGVRAVALVWFDVPAATLPLAPLILASVGATLGPAFGCYMAFRRPVPQSMRKFLLPGAALTLLGLALEVARFGAGHRHWGALLVGASQGLVAIALVLPVLLWRVAAYRR